MNLGERHARKTRKNGHYRQFSPHLKSECRFRIIVFEPATFGWLPDRRPEGCLFQEGTLLFSCSPLLPQAVRHEASDGEAPQRTQLRRAIRWARRE